LKGAWAMAANWFADAVKRELQAARKGNPPMHSLHEGYAVIMEEVEEFWAEVMRKPAERNKKRLAEELMQVAAMCQRTAEDLGLDTELARVNGAFPLPAAA
jgi:NTP pyrophosphatase (non-canonical NTP hydrolase)